MKTFRFERTYSSLFLLTLLWPASLVLAAPVINGGPVNAASYALHGLPNSGIAQGGMFVLFGSGMGPLQLVQVGAFPIPTELGGTSVTVTVGTSSIDCLMLYALDRQVAAILPSNTPLGTGTVRVTFDNQTSDAVPIEVVPARFGVFTRNQAGMGPGIIQNFNSLADQPVNSLLEAAGPGQTVVLWGTGLGPVTGNEAGGPLPGDMTGLPMEIFVGGQPATVTYRGRSGCCAGIDQVVFVVPADVQGCRVSVDVLAGGVLSNSTTMAIAAERGPCPDPIHVTSTDITRIQGGGDLNRAEMRLHHLAAKIAISGRGTLEGNVEWTEAHFARVAADSLLASTGIQSFPSLGSCTLQQFQYEDFFESIMEHRDPIPSQSIDAGPALSVTGPHGTVQLPKQPSSEGSYEARLGGIDPDNPTALALPDFLDAGVYTFSNGAGSAAVGAFNTQIVLPGKVSWSNRDALPSPVPRDQPLVITWSGADRTSEFVFIVGSSADPASGSGVSFFCTADAGLGTFTVPARVLGALPASGLAEEGPVGFLTVGNVPLRTVSDAVVPNLQIVYQYYFFGSLVNTNYQ